MTILKLKAKMNFLQKSKVLLSTESETGIQKYLYRLQVELFWASKVWYQLILNID